MIPDWLKGSLLVLFGAFLWGTMVVATKGATHIQPMTLATVRAGMAAAGCFLWFSFYRPGVLKVGPRRLFLLFIYGGASSGLLYGGFTIALTYLSVAASEVIFFTFPLFTTIAGIFILNERPSTAQIVSCLLIIAGVFVMTALTGGAETDAPLSARGVGAAVLALLGMTVQSVTGRKNAQKNWMPTETLFSWAQFFAFVWMALYKTLTTGWGDLPSLPAASWLLMTYMGLVATLLGYGAYNLGLRYICAATAGMLASFELVTAVALAALLLSTPPSAGETAGCVIILTALFLSARSAQKTSVICA